MFVRVQDQPLDPWEQMRQYRPGDVDDGSFGATAVFVGTMRDFNEGDVISGMTLEHYPGMTEKFLQKIAKEAQDHRDVLDVLIVHRVGELAPGDPIVLVAAWSAHRAAAFEACRYLIEQLKARAPFWKKEVMEAGRARWVERNT